MRKNYNHLALVALVCGMVHLPTAHAELKNNFKNRLSKLKGSVSRSIQDFKHRTIEHRAKELEFKAWKSNEAFTRQKKKAAANRAQVAAYNQKRVAYYNNKLKILHIDLANAHAKVFEAQRVEGRKATLAQSSDDKKAVKDYKKASKILKKEERKRDKIEKTIARNEKKKARFAGVLFFEDQENQKHDNCPKCSFCSSFDSSPSPAQFHAEFENLRNIAGFPNKEEQENRFKQVKAHLEQFRAQREQERVKSALSNVNNARVSESEINNPFMEVEVPLSVSEGSGRQEQVNSQSLSAASNSNLPSEEERKNIVKKLKLVHEQLKARHEQHMNELRVSNLENGVHNVNSASNGVDIDIVPERVELPSAASHESERTPVRPSFHEMLEILKREQLVHAERMKEMQSWRTRN